jgi:gluconolactonase
MDTTRRTMLAAAGGAAIVTAARDVLAADFLPAMRYPDPAVEIVDPSFEKYRLSLVAVERVATGLRWAEGPVWFGDFRTLIFSDVSNNRMMKWDEDTGELGIFRKPSNYSNGNARDRQGRLITCEHQTRRVTRTEYDGTITVLMDSFNGKALNSPNDIVCKSDGTIWFTDPAFGPNPLEAMAKPELPGNVYRLDPATKRATVVAGSVKGPNGLCFSPDESKLYIIESRATPNRLIRVYDVVGGTTLSNDRVFYDCGKGTADGFRADMDGNLWCGWGMGEAEDGVIVLSPEGKMIGRIRLPERCPNLCFGGVSRNRLLMASTKSIYALYVNTQGARLD